MTLVSDYAFYYRFLKSVISFLRSDWIPINCYILRHIRMSIYPILTAFHFVATSIMLFNVMKAGDMVTFSFGTIWFSGSLQAFIKTLTGIYYKEQFLVFFAGIEEIVKMQFDKAVDGIIKKILKETLTLTKICHFSITIIFNTTVFLLVVRRTLRIFSRSSSKAFKGFLTHISLFADEWNEFPIWTTPWLLPISLQLVG